MNNALILNMISSSNTQTTQTKAPSEAGELFGELIGSIANKFADKIELSDKPVSKFDLTFSAEELNELESTLSAFLALIMNLSEKIELDNNKIGGTSPTLSLTETDSKLLSPEPLNDILSLLNDLKTSLSSTISQISDKKFSLNPVKETLDTAGLKSAIQNLNNSSIKKQIIEMGAKLSAETANLTFAKTISSDIDTQTSFNIQAQSNLKPQSGYDMKPQFNDADIIKLLPQVDEINNRLKELLSSLTGEQKTPITQIKSNSSKLDVTLSPNIAYSSSNQDASKLINNNDVGNNSADSILLTHINEQLSWASRNETNNPTPEIAAVEFEPPLINDNKSIADIMVSADKANLSTARAFHGAINVPFASEAWQNAFNKQMLSFIKNGIQNAELRLHPQELGVINVQLSLDDNLVKLQLFSANAQVRNSMENTLNNLKTAFNEQGYHLDESFIGNENQHNSQFNDSSHAFERSNSPNFQGREIDESQVSNDTNPQSKPLSSARSVGIDNFI